MLLITPASVQKDDNLMKIHANVLRCSKNCGKSLGSLKCAKDVLKLKIANGYKTDTGLLNITDCKFSEGF